VEECLENTGLLEMIVWCNCPAAIPHQIREISTIGQFHSKLVCTVSRDRVRVYPELKVRIRTATETITADMRNELNYRADVCIITKGAAHRAPVRYVTKTWSVVLSNKKYIYSHLKCIVYDTLLKP